jgi:hypothetical protein
MSYTRIQITASGISFNNTLPTGEAFDVLLYTTAPVTLIGNVTVAPIVYAGVESSFSVRWEANLTLSTFSVVIAGVTLAQDQVNQNGTFSCYYDGTTWSVQYFADGKDQPQAAQGVTNVPVPVGGTLTLTAGVDAAYQRLVGSPTTLTSNYTVTAGTVGIKAGSQFQIEIAGGITIGANTLTVFGISINANQALTGGVIILATFDGVSTWVAASTSRPVTTADIVPIVARTVMGNATNATAAPTDIAFPTDFGVLQRNGTTLTTGLLTFSSFDTTSVVANRVSIVSLTSAQLLALSTTPITIVPAPGINTVNVISSITISCAYVGVTYTGDTNLVAYSPTAFDKLYEGIDLLGFTTTSITQMNNINIGAQTYQYVANEALLLSTLATNPLTGDGTIKVTVIYQTIAS